jgi:hypothetical protein
MPTPTVTSSGTSYGHSIKATRTHWTREVTTWFRQQPKEFYAAGFQGLVKQWDKRLIVQGDNAET